MSHALRAFDSLIGRSLRAVRALSPWILNAHAPSPSAAWLFEFDALTLVCLSPLRLRSSQNGSAFGLEGGDLASFGFRIHLADKDTASSMVPSLEPGSSRFEPGWLRLHRIPLLGQKLTHVRAVRSGLDSWMLEFEFGDGSVRQMRYRLDLDGTLEFAEPGVRHDIGLIEVARPDQPFGWLHPAAPIPFVFDDCCWASAALRDWPFTLRKALRASPDPNGLRHDILLGAMRARFRQNVHWRRRLAHLARPVSCPDCPSDVYTTIKAL